MLTPEKAYNELIGKPSTVVRNPLRVAPFRSSESYLVDKLTGNRIVGERMPLGRPKTSRLDHRCDPHMDR
ncbi:MAG: hypothetical protein C4326_15155 [Ignavibacteria bacterium]